MKRYFLLSFWLVLALPGSAQTDALDSYLARLYKNHFIPGFSVVVVQGDQVIYQRGFGVQYSDGPEPMQARTSLAVGSLTKSFTALALLQLQEEDLLSLDDPVVRYLPWFRTANKEMSDQITIRMLLNNTSGLQAPAIRNRDNSDRAAEHLVRSLSSVHLNRIPGSSYAYSNDGYAVAGLLIETVSGMSYEEYMQQRIFAPLEMPNSTHDPARFDRIGTLYGHYQGISGAIPVHREDDFLGEYVAAGSLMRSSATELGHYLIALLNGGTYHHRTILSPESIRELWEPGASLPGISREDGGEGLPFSYGLGWFLGKLDGKDYIFHGGNRRSMSSMTFIYPEGKVAVAFLANIDLTFVDRYHYPNLVHILNNIIRITLGEEESDFALPVVPDPTENSFLLPENEQEAYLGNYRLSSGNDWVYLDSRLSIYRGDKGLEGEIFRGNQLLERFKIDFLTRRTAVSRNLAMPQEIQFGFLRSGEVSSIYISGKKYARISEAYLASFQEVRSPDDRIRFRVPREWRTEWGEISFQGSDQKQTVLRGALVDEPSGPDSIFMALVPNQPIRHRGLQFSELTGSRIWESRSYVTRVQDRERYHYLFFTRGEKRAYAFVLSTDGNLSLAVNRYVPAIQDNFQWTE